MVMHSQMVNKLIHIKIKFNIVMSGVQTLYFNGLHLRKNITLAIIYLMDFESIKNFYKDKFYHTLTVC